CSGDDTDLHAFPTRRSSDLALRANANRLDDVAFFDNATGCCGFDGADDQIADMADAAASRAAQHFNAHQFFRAGVVGNSQTCEWLNHGNVLLSGKWSLLVTLENNRFFDDLD